MERNAENRAQARTRPNATPTLFSPKALRIRTAQAGLLARSVVSAFPFVNRRTVAIVADHF